MNHLRELGLDTSDASFCWSVRTGLPNLLLPYNDEVFERCAVTMTMPAYTLQDILDKLPMAINEGDATYLLFIATDEKYGYGFMYEQILGDSLCCSAYKNNALDAAYELLVWCIEEGYVKTKGEDNEQDRIGQGTDEDA